MQGRFKMEYRLLTIVRYNYRDYNKGCPKPFNWSIINLLYLFYPIRMQGRFKMEYRLFTIVRYNYRDYNRD